MKIAILICGHGSRNPKSAEEFMAFVNSVEELVPEQNIFHAFLEKNNPSIDTAISDLYHEGYRKIRVLPLFLFDGTHTLNDIPGILKTLKTRFEDLDIELDEVIGLPELIRKDIIDDIQNNVDLSIKTHLILVGVGNSLPDGNKALELFYDELKKSFPELQISLSYISHQAKPSFQEIVQHDAHTFDQIIVLPVMLFGGFYMSFIDQYIEDVSHNTPASIIKLNTLGEREVLLNVFLAKIH